METPPYNYYMAVFVKYLQNLHSLGGYKMPSIRREMIFLPNLMIR